MNFKTLYLALRPWSLPASVSPVIVGTAIAFGDGKGNGLAAFLALMVAVFIHFGTNVVNDIGDFRSGVDAANAEGTFNVIERGVVPEKTMIHIAIGCFAIAIFLGLTAVVIQKAWILIPVGSACILAGIWYTAGPKPAGYIGLGELLVVVFFGPVSSMGTYYIQSRTVTFSTFLAGLACGLICSGILIVNNYRDYEADKQIGKKTLAVRFGRRFAQWEYLVVMIIAGIIPIIVFVMTGKTGVLIACLIIIYAIKPIRIVFSKNEGPVLSQTVALTGKLLGIFSILFSMGYLLP